MLNKVTDLIEQKKINHSTPYFLIDKGRIVYNYLYFKHKLNFSERDIFYSVKANNNSEIINELKILGGGFEIASIFELQTLVNLDIDLNRIIFSNPVKIPNHIAGCYKMGVNKFAFDTYNELYKISLNAPNSNVFLRLDVDNKGADWSLDKKFGANKENVTELFLSAKKLKLKPYAITFHNGWNNTNIETWKNNLLFVKDVILKCREDNIELTTLNIGGGFPAHNIDQFKFLDQLAENINPILDDLRTNHNINIIAEPGSFLVNYTGILVAKIYDIVKRGASKWIFIDTGIMQGFPWVLSNLKYEIHYPYNNSEKSEKEPYFVTGPTNDSKDIFGTYYFPDSIRINDYLCIYPAGAYTISSNEYNGYKIPEIKFL